MLIAAPIDQVWRVLLDPNIMARCVPGVQSVDMLSDTEYLATIKVKISFIAANFKVKTTILETSPPHYLRCEGAGEDASVASSLKQVSEMFLAAQPDGGTELRVKARAEVLGRLGSFGLSVMKTKADRMWEEFGANLSAVLRTQATAPAPAGAPARARDADAKPAAHGAANPGTPRSGPPLAAEAAAPARRKWWSWLDARPRQDASVVGELRLPTDIYVEVHRGGDVIRVLWPSSMPAEATAWLKDILGK